MTLVNRCLGPLGLFWQQPSMEGIWGGSSVQQVEISAGGMSNPQQNSSLPSSMWVILGCCKILRRALTRLFMVHRVICHLGRSLQYTWMGDFGHKKGTRVFVSEKYWTVILQFWVGRVNPNYSLGGNSSQVRFVPLVVLSIVTIHLHNRLHRAVPLFH